MVVMQSLVAAGMGVTTIPGPPDPPATVALVAALTQAATTIPAHTNAPITIDGS
jgi:hypothetical protein